jgi:N-acetylglucosamine-6-sulfatase
MKLLRNLLLYSLLLGGAADARRPNVVVILADDHRHDWMGHKGRAFMATPHLDQLASEGISFDNAFACSGVCSPSRASILTGKYAHRASAPDIAWRNNSFLTTQTMFPQLLHQAGYRTGYIGKFHLGLDDQPKPGFDHWAGFPFVGDFFNQTITVNGKPVATDGFTDDRIAGMAADWIRAQSGGGRPFCLIVGLKAPHIPFVYPERMKRVLGDTVFPEPASYRLRNPNLAQTRILAADFPPAIPAYGNFQEWVRSYSRLATTIDDSVGTIVTALRKSGELDDTLLLYLSDQGYSLGEFGLCEKHFAYEQVMRIPLIARFPSWIKPGKRCDEMVLNLDVAPTILDACGVAAPEGLDGRSWKPLMSDGKAPWRDDFMFDFWHYERKVLPPLQAVRTRTHKLVEYQFLPGKELYDLVNDPNETTNLYGRPDIREVQADLEKRIARIKRETDWRPIEVRPLRRLWLLGPLDPEHERELRPALAGLRRPEPFTAAGREWSWRAIECDADGVFDPGPLPQGQVFFLGVPLARTTEYDPYVKLAFSPANVADKPPLREFPMAALHHGEIIWRNNEDRKAAGEQSMAIFNDHCNFPLPGKQELALFRCIANPGMGKIAAKIIAPAGSLQPVP